MKAKATALIFVAMFALLGVSTREQILAHGAKSVPYRPAKTFPEPNALPDLIIQFAKFYFNSAVVVVQNVGGSSSDKTSLTLVIFSGSNPLSQVQDTLSKPVPALHPGQKFKVEFDIGKLTFQGHARRVIVDDKNQVAESDEKNNALFSNTAPVPGEAAFPDPASNLVSNLTFTMVKFIAPNTAHFCVKDSGSVSGSFWVKISIFKAAAKDSGIYNAFSLEHDPLQPGEIKCADWFYNGTDWDWKSGVDKFPTKSILEGRGRLIEIITEGKVTDADSTNKSYFSPGIEGLWQKKN